MVINGIEYNIRLYVYDAYTNEDIAEELFDDLAQMADFIEKTYIEERFIDAQGEYEFVEVINGFPDAAGSTSYVVDPYYPMDEEDLEEVLQDFMVEVPRYKEQMKKEWEKDLAFHPLTEENEPGDASKDIPLSEYSYICPSCFNEVKECTCSHYPYNLIQIDRLMVPIIKELNCKGYVTMYSCAGHPDYQRKVDNPFIGISFIENYDFPIPFPPGAVYSKSSSQLAFMFPDDRSPDVLSEYQHNCLNALLRWAQTL